MQLEKDIADVEEAYKLGITNNEEEIKQVKA
jgi:hypothetical protein